MPTTRSKTTKNTKTATKTSAAKKAVAESQDGAQSTTELVRKTTTSDEPASSDLVPRALSGSAGNRLQTILDENLGGAPLALSDLTRLKVPSGGTTQFEIPSPISGKPKYAETIEGVIVAHQMGKAYWEKSLNDGGGNSAPDCKSNDMIHGIGKPGIYCNAHGEEQPQPCPFNVFGSANKGKGEGKACKDLRFLFILEGRSVLPKVLIVPPTSLRAIKEYLLALANDEISFYSVVTKFELTQDKNAANIKFSRIVPQVAAELNEAETSRALNYYEMIKPLIQNMASAVASSDIADDDEHYEKTSRKR